MVIQDRITYVANKQAGMKWVGKNDSDSDNNKKPGFESVWR